jgi:hypothetical protein
VRSAEGSEVMGHNNKQLPTLTKYRLTYLNACPSALAFEATVFDLIQGCALFVYSETKKQGKPFVHIHLLTYPDF